MKNKKLKLIALAGVTVTTAVMLTGCGKNDVKTYDKEQVNVNIEKVEEQNNVGENKLVVENIENKVSENAGNNIVNETNNNEIKKVNKVDANKEIVYSSYSKFSSEYSYSIPYINIKSDDVNKINKEIENYYKPLVEAELKDESEGHSITMYNIKYTSYINDNILSLVISNQYPNDCIYYKVYNLDIYTGATIKNSDIIKLKNMTESKYLDMLKEQLEEKFISVNGSKEKLINNMREHPEFWTEDDIQQNSKFYDIQFNSTISKNNYSMETPIFLNENGKLCIIANIYSMAGADSYYHIINTNI